MMTPKEKRLAAVATEVMLPPDRTVIRQGDDPDDLWVLSEGALSVCTTADGHAPRDLPPVNAPGYVGELGLLHGMPRTATVRTSQESILLRISGQQFLDAMQTGRPSASLLAIAGTRMARTRA